MLAASIHEHAGLGNQIWRYVCCRVFAENLGYEWGVSHPGWRGPFLNIDWGKDVPFNVEQARLYLFGKLRHSHLNFGFSQPNHECSSLPLLETSIVDLGQ